MSRTLHHVWPTSAGLMLSAILVVAWSPAPGQPVQDPARFDEASAKLQSLRQRYTDAHPAVIEARRELESLNRSAAAAPSTDEPLPQPPPEATALPVPAARGAESPALKALREHRARSREAAPAAFPGVVAAPAPLPASPSLPAPAKEASPAPRAAESDLEAALSTRNFYPGGTLRLPVIVQEIAGVGAARFPVVAVVPLPKGRYRDPSRFRLEGPDGAVVPAQIEVLDRWWSRDGSVRHLQLQFQADVEPHSEDRPDSGMSLYHLTDGGGVPTPSGPLTIRDGEERIEVVTGPLRFVVSKRQFRLFESVELDVDGDGRFEPGELLLTAGDRSGGVLQGRGKDDLQLDSARGDIKVSLEESGPLRAVIHVSAPARDQGPKRQEHGFAVRIYAYSGLPFVKVDYQLQNSDKNVHIGRPLYFDSLVLELAPKAMDNPVVRVGIGSGKTIERERGGGLLLAQARHDRFSVSDRSSAEVFADGKRADGFVDLRGGGKGITAMIRFFWETWPNGLSVSAEDSIGVQLFPAFSSQWHRGKLNSSGLYWLADMQHVYKETLLRFHDGGLSDRDLHSLARTFDEPPVAALPPAWYRLTGVTLDMGGVIPSKSTTKKRKRRFQYQKDAYSFDKKKYRFGWDNFYLVDPGRKFKPSTAGSWAYGFGAYTLDANPGRIRELEIMAMGELNARPQWLHGYEHETDGKRLELGAQLPWQANSWRRKGKIAKYEVPGTAIRARPRDDAHGWHYHIREGYYATANSWLRDWYRFIGEYRKTQLGRPGLRSSRGLAHALSHAVDAYRVTGDTGIISAAHDHINRRLRREQDRRYGFRNSLCCGRFGEAAFQAGYLARSIINLMEEVEPTSQIYADAFQLLSGIMEWNRNFANFSMYINATKGEIGKSHGTGLTFVDPQAWYYWHTGKRAYWTHLRDYMDGGIADGRRPFGKHQFGNWRGTFPGRWYLHVSETPRPDSTPPPLIEDLTAVPAGRDGTRLRFQKPTDAVRYHIVWGDLPISEDLSTDEGRLNWWAANALAAAAATEPRAETIDIPGKVGFAAVFSFDAADNMSLMSNLVKIPE